MPLKIIRQDITEIECDAIVNPSNRNLRPGGGADLAIHEAAGEELLKACREAGGCEVGKAKVTDGFNLPCKYVIHTAGPDFFREENSEEILISCYSECLEKAKEYGCESVAFPLISTGAYGFPKDRALKIATKVIGDFLYDNEMTVYIVVYDKESYYISKKVFSDIKSYIDDNYTKEHADRDTFFGRRRNVSSSRRRLEPEECACVVCEDFKESSEEESLEDVLKNMDKGFSEMLFYYIDSKGMTDVECYKKANIDRKLFSKIRSDKNYKPSKQTVISFAISLELTLGETEDMLKRAGFALSKSNKADIIIEYFISKGIYDIFTINEALFAFDQSLLGA